MDIITDLEIIEYGKDWMYIALKEMDEENDVVEYIDPCTDTDLFEGFLMYLRSDKKRVEESTNWKNLLCEGANKSITEYNEDQKEGESQSVLMHIEMLLEEQEKTRYETDNYFGDVNELIEELEEIYNVEQNGSMLYISKK